VQNAFLSANQQFKGTVGNSKEEKSPTGLNLFSSPTGNLRETRDVFSVPSATNQSATNQLKPNNGYRSMITVQCKRQWSACQMFETYRGSINWNSQPRNRTEIEYRVTQNTGQLVTVTQKGAKYFTR